MTDLDKVKSFVASISEKEISDEELLQKSNEFFVENCSEIDAELVNTLLSAKAEGANIGLELMESYAYKGSPAAQLAIGVLKLEGKGIEKNVPEAIFWLKRAYIGKNPKSGFMLSSIYANGIGVAENMAKAREYLKGSADMGVPKAQYYYAGMLIDGDGGATDEETAIDYMFMAANNGYEDAVTFLRDNDLIKRGCSIFCVSLVTGQYERLSAPRSVSTAVTASDSSFVPGVSNAQMPARYRHKAA